jgi:hypothetical protein
MYHLIKLNFNFYKRKVHMKASKHVCHICNMFKLSKLLLKACLSWY